MQKLQDEVQRTSSLPFKAAGWTEEEPLQLQL